MHPQALGQREIRLWRLYCGCQFGLSPQAFYARWGVTPAQMAQSCGISQPSAARWFSLGKNRRAAEAIHGKKLAEMNFIWAQYERMPLQLRRQLCPARRNGQVLSP